MTSENINSYTKRKDVDFTMIQNFLIRTPTISCKGKTLLNIGLSHSGGWKFNKNQIATCFKEAAHTVDSAMKELRSLGYLHLVARKGEDGKMNGHRWFWFDIPISKEEFKEEFKKICRNSGFPDLGDFGASENHGCLRKQTLKKTNLKKEQQQPQKKDDKKQEASTKAPTRCVVVPSSLQSLEGIPDPVKRKLSEKWSKEQIEKACKVVRESKDIENPCGLLIDAMKNDYEPKGSKEDIIERNRAWKEERIRPYDGKMLGVYKVDVLDKSIELSIPGMSIARVFEIKNVKFKEMVCNFVASLRSKNVE
jgi:hypothetical protein